MHMHSLRRSLRLLIPVLSVAATMAVCASSNSIAAAASPSSAGALTAKPKPKPKPHKVTNPLSGTWSGQYSGTFSGTFTLHWTQSGSRLNGKITLSNPGSTLGVNGTVTGGTIKFGTVGGPGITYAGSVSGSKSMSGSYQTPKGGGSWSANKTS